MLTAEPGWRRHMDAIEQFASCRLSAANYLEAAIVLDAKRSGPAGERLDVMIEELGIAVVPVTIEQARLAREAYRRFGKGNHPARLNFGDCFAYALSKATGEPLLFKGEDFRQTDVEPAISGGEPPP